MFRWLSIQYYSVNSFYIDPLFTKITESPRKGVYLGKKITGSRDHVIVKMAASCVQREELFT